MGTDILVVTFLQHDGYAVWSQEDNCMYHGWDLEDLRYHKSIGDTIEWADTVEEETL